MAKGKTTVFFCQNCGYESSKWLGQCPGCREWNTMVEEKVSGKSSGAHGNVSGRKDAEPVSLGQVDLGEKERMTTHMAELDRVLGGGIVPGSLTLVGGDPGIGKSTLLLQVCRHMAADGHKLLY
ncbi:MAG: AAA family ATPase, partial [Lachnospiraceae bacterium]|nr:AAA family ATPase [Lachnospiraceae bacterium]